jgi:hypothetical protein
VLLVEAQALEGTWPRLSLSYVTQRLTAAGCGGEVGSASAGL